MKFLHLFFLIVASLSLFSQNDSDTLNSRLKVDIPQLRDHIYSGIPSYSKKGEYEKMTYQFADETAYYISTLLTDGYVYDDWIDLEEYVNDILFEIMPEELKKDTTIHAYIYQNGSVNAFMTPSGQFFVHIGLISRCNDEATLASVLAHELAHYYKRHSLESYIQRNLGNFNNGLFNNDGKSNRFSVKHELEADSLAMIWIKNSDYSLNGVLKSVKIIEYEENRRLSRLEDHWEQKKGTHPLAEQRVKKFNLFYKKNKRIDSKDFLINEKMFIDFKEKAKKESLRSLLDNIKYYDCLELAFKFHLMDPDNPVYVYYIMESTRRLCYIDNSLWNENFISNRYYDTIRVDGMRRKKEVTRSLFEKLDFKLLPITQEDAKYIKARFYWQGEQKFKTYNEAFEFYNRLGKALNCNECILSNALSITKAKDINLRNKLLNDYLSKDEIIYKEYANNLLKGTIRKKLANKKLMVFNEFQVGIRQGEDKIYIRNFNSDTINYFHNILDSVKKFDPKRAFIYLPDLKNTNLTEFKTLSILEYFTIIRRITNDQERKSIKKPTSTIIKLHILDPRYIDLFHKYNVNEIEFVNWYYTESQKMAKTIEEYKDIINTSYQDLFTKTKSTKSIFVVITSLREIENKRLQMRAIGHETSIKFKDSSYKSIINEIKYKIKYKEKTAFDIDALDAKYIINK